MTMTDQLERDFFFIVHMLTDVSEQLLMHLATFAANGRLAANGRAGFEYSPWILRRFYTYTLATDHGNSPLAPVLRRW